MADEQLVEGIRKLTEDRRHLKPLMYEITFMLDGIADRKPSVIVLAKDAHEAIETAQRHLRETHGPARLTQAKLLMPRWVSTDTCSPDVLSTSALKYYQGTQVDNPR